MPRNTTPSNVTGLAFAVEEAIGELPTTPVWNALEPNSYGDFGADVETVARQPITADRQMKKGVVVGITCAADFETDLTEQNFPQIMEGFMFADIRDYLRIEATAASATGYTVASGGGDFEAGDLIYVTGGSNAANNGLKVVTGSSGTEIEVAGLEVETASFEIARVGFEFDEGDVEIIKPVGGLPRMESALKDLTDFDLLPGAWVFVGGDATSNRFEEETNIGWARIKTITATAITFDKTDQEYETDDGAGRSVRLFYSRMLRNEQREDQVRRTYHLERQLGAPDPSQPSEIQAEYVKGAVPNECSIQFSEGAIVTMDVAFLGTDYFTRDATDGPLAGTRPALVESDGFSGNADVRRVRMSSVPEGAAAPTPLFNFVREASVTVNNNVSENRALSRVGAIDMTEGMFEVTGDLTVYFVDVSAAQAVRDNADITFDLAFAKANKGFVIDLPLITLGDGRNQVEANEPITIELEQMAASGAKYDPAFNFTLSLSFFEYLPEVASLRAV